ncbi:MAG: DUF4445 domain-containing protein [Lachnospiraceae bacterium]|nr:DUF4445 domain-containing protein [Lachnospiraceae bacterium]
MKLSEMISMPLECGGNGRCGKCKLRVSGALSPLSPQERGLLTQEEIEAGYRLACMTEIEGDYTIHSLPSERLAVQLDFTELAGAPSSGREGIGAAIDIGTTTLAAYWYDLSSGRRINTKSAANPQRIFGADVISRIEHAAKGRLPQLSACLRQAVLSLLPPVYEHLVLTGNTTMLYLLCGYDPAELASAPFHARHTFGFQRGTVMLPPCFSAYIGADLACAALAAGFASHLPEKPTLLLDIGTNGEMLLAANGLLYGCSAAAGPAFEGNHISCGLPSVPGAICHVQPDFSYETIENLPAKGYCGSGILDITAALLDHGALSASGVLSAWPAPALPLLTQQDIREIQLAKAAIAAACQALMHAAHVDALDTLYLAGGFGSQLSPESARQIGLLPPARHTLSLGNAAGHGSAMLLLNPALLEKVLALKKSFRLCELADDPFFTDAFMSCMRFPE